MSINSQGTVLGANTIVGATLVSTGTPIWVSTVLGASIFITLFGLYFVSKFLNKKK